MADKKSTVFRYYMAGSLLLITVLFVSVETATRCVSYFSGNGFFLALHERDAYDPGIQGLYSWHPFTGFVFQPNRQIKGGHPNQPNKSLVTVDQHGFLSSDSTLSYEKPPNEISIATIGASTTANINLSYHENWPGMLGSLLQEALPDNRIRIINAGVPGYDTAQSIGNLALRVMPFKPDIVIIYHAYNDLKAIRTDKVFAPDYSHVHTKPYGYHEPPGILTRLLNESMFYVRTRNRYREYRKNKEFAEWQTALFSNENRSERISEEALRTFTEHVKSLAAIARGGGAKVVLSSFATLHDCKANYADRAMLQGLTALQQKELIAIDYFFQGLTVEAVLRGVALYNQALEAIATEENTGWVDNAVLVPHEDSYFVDRVHFAPKGAEQMARNFLPVVHRLLTEDGE